MQSQQQNESSYSPTHPDEEQLLNYGVQAEDDSQNGGYITPTATPVYETPGIESRRLRRQINVFRETEQLLAQQRRENLKKLQQVIALRIPVRARKLEIEKNLAEQMNAVVTLQASLCQNQKTQSRIKQYELRIQKLGQVVQQKRDEVEKQSKIIKERQDLLQERKKYQELFEVSLRQHYIQCRERFNEVEILKTVVKGRIRLFQFQLSTIFFNDDMSQVFLGLRGVEKVLKQYSEIQNNEELINCALGYFTLLIIHMSKYNNINIRYRLIFKGSRSQIQKSGNETLNLYILKQKEVDKLRIAIDLFTFNIFQIFDALCFEKYYKKTDLLFLLDIICRYMYFGEIREYDGHHK